MLLFHVTRGYEIDAYLGNAYAPLVEALGTGAGSGLPLRTSHFLLEIDAKLPRTVHARYKATPADVVHVVRDVEDADKKFFVRFIPHARDGQRHVTEANLAKARTLMNQHVHDWCLRNNVSTGWADIDPGTPIPEKAPDWQGYSLQQPLKKKPRVCGASDMHCSNSSCAKRQEY